MLVCIASDAITFLHIPSNKSTVAEKFLSTDSASHVRHVSWTWPEPKPLKRGCAGRCEDENSIISPGVVRFTLHAKLESYAVVVRSTPRQWMGVIICWDIIFTFPFLTAPEESPLLNCSRIKLTPSSSNVMLTGPSTIRHDSVPLQMYTRWGSWLIKVACVGNDHPRRVQALEANCPQQIGRHCG